MWKLGCDQEAWLYQIHAQLPTVIGSPTCRFKKKRDQPIRLPTINLAHCHNDHLTLHRVDDLGVCETGVGKAAPGEVPPTT